MPRGSYFARLVSLKIALMLCAVVPLAGCGKKEAQLTPTAPAKVEVAAAVTREIIDFEDFTGRLEAIHRIDIRAQVKGQLTKVHFKEGEEVKKGDILFEIDPTIYKAEFELAEANVNLASVRVKGLRGDYERGKILLANKSMNREQFDKILADYNESVAAEKVALTSRQKAEINLGYTKVYAEPVGGITGRAMIDPGNFVDAEKTILTTIVAFHSIYAYFDVDERTILERDRRRISEGKVRTIEPDSKVLLALSDEKEFEHVGTVDFVDNTVNPGTGTKRMRAIFDNPKKLLAPGLFVRIRYPIGTPHPAIVIPEIAIGSDQGQKYVYVVGDDNEVAYRKVRTGSQVKSYRVIEEPKYKQKDDGTFETNADGKRTVVEGLEQGEKVIVSGLQRVRPRAKVDYKMKDTPADAGLSQITTLLRTQLSRERLAPPQTKEAPASP